MMIITVIITAIISKNSNNKDNMNTIHKPWRNNGAISAESSRFCACSFFFFSFFFQQTQKKKEKKFEIVRKDRYENIKEVQKEICIGRLIFKNFCLCTVCFYFEDLVTRSFLNLIMLVCLLGF